MFLPHNEVTKIAEAARRNLYEYLYVLSLRADRLNELTKAVHELQRLEPVSLDPAVSSNDRADHYVSDLMRVLDFLESGQPVPVPENANAFNCTLELLKRLREDLVIFAALGDSPAIPTFAQSIKDFGRYVARHLGCAIVFYAAPREFEAFLDGKGCASWLVVRRANPTQLHVIYNRRILTRGDENALVREQRYEKVFLHEIAHAVLHLKYITDQLDASSGAPVSVLPRHEVEASVYAFVVRGLVVGMRSRMDRVLNHPDVSWTA